MFQVGEGVICVNAECCPELTEGATYVVSRVITAGEYVEFQGGAGFANGDAVWVVGGCDFFSLNDDVGYWPERFVHRRDLTAWLATETTFEEPKRLHPAPAVDALFRRILAGGDR